MNFDKFSDWQRNVIDEYKALSVDEIKQDLAKKALPFAVCFQHLEHDFNMGSGIRNANAFGAKEVFYIGGKRQWDRRAAVGVQHYTKLTFLRSIDMLKDLKSTYQIIGLDNIPGSKPLETFIWPSNSLMVFGEERDGLTKDILKQCDDVVAITQRGSVRSLNVGCASAIAMYDYSIKYRG